MIVPFEMLPANARIWIYQADRKLNTAENHDLALVLTDFCERWQAHGQPLQTAFRIEYNQFVLLAVDADYGDTSGCSIDGSVRILKAFQEKWGIDFFNRSNVAFLVNNEVRLYPAAELKSQFASGQLRPASLTFYNLVATKGELQTKWLVKADDSWLRKFMPQSAVAAGK